MKVTLFSKFPPPASRLSEVGPLRRLNCLSLDGSQLTIPRGIVNNQQPAAATDGKPTLTRVNLESEVLEDLGKREKSVFQACFWAKSGCFWGPVSDQFLTSSFPTTRPGASVLEVPLRQRAQSVTHSASIIAFEVECSSRPVLGTLRVPTGTCRLGL